MSLVYSTPADVAMQPALHPCAFDNEGFVDFESAHQYSITTAEDWTLSDLDEAALGIEQRTQGVGSVKVKPEVKKPSLPAVTSSTSSSPRAAVGVMKASMLEPSDDDIFSSNTRNYNSFNKTRPTMISAKYRLKEERRKVLKISINKLKKIEDPESSLRRSVLINNTMKRLQKEARDERREKQQIHSFPRYSPSYKSFVLREEPPKPVADDQIKTPDAPSRLKPDSNKENASPYPSDRKHPPKSSLESCFCEETMEELVDVTSLDDELSRPLEELANPVNMLETTSMDDATGRCASRKRSFDDDTGRPLEALNCLMDTDECKEKASSTVDAESSGKRRCDAEVIEVTTRKRSYEDVEDAEIHDVLSQFYMPPTPRMLTSIDDDEDEEVNVVDIEIEMPLSPTAIVPKVLGFEELVREELKDEPITLVDNRSEFDILNTELNEEDVSPPCKRPRFDSGPLIHGVPVFDNMSHPNSPVKSYSLPFETRSVEKNSFGFIDTTAESKNSEFVASSNVALTSRTCATATASVAMPSSDVGSVNCGTVSTSLASENDDCASSLLPCSRGDAVEIKDMKNVDFTTKENPIVDRRSHITRISEAMSWTSIMNDTRTDSQDYKYNNNNNNNNGLSKTLTDCCYSQETNNNLSEPPNKYSCAHAAITELQSQVYHSYVTSLES